jgi:hypothetical protein
MKKIIQKALSHSSLLDQPPVLIDIGASGTIHKKWKIIAPYSICIAFDADTRDFTTRVENNRGFKKLFLINRILAVKSNDGMDFWLTRSPHCSSSLSPNNQALKQWAFAPLFDINKKVTMQAVTLEQVLLSCELDYIDWYKSDSQGTDLRLFDSLDNSIKRNIIVSEFEPGILDAYLGEDKLSALMLYMDKEPFWVQDMFIKGSQRINEDSQGLLTLTQRKFISSFVRTSPGWCEIVYMNTFDSLSTKRDYLLGWIFAMILEEYGFALGLAVKAGDMFDEPIFSEMKSCSLNKIHNGYIRLFTRLANRAVYKLIAK